MKRLPSAGFVCLIFVILFSGLFFFWVVSEGWYDKIYSSEEDLAKWASYLEKVAIDFPDNKKRITFYKEAAELRSRSGQSEKALIDLERAIRIDPEDDILKAKIVLEKYESGQSKEAVAQARNRFGNGKRDWETISILIADQVENPNSNLRSELIEEIKNADIPGKQIFDDGRIVMLGFSVDGWTVKGKPGYLRVKGSGEKEISQKIVLGCYADKKDLPLTVTIEDGYRKLSHTFHRAGRVNIRLPKIDPGQNGLFVVKTDKTWIPVGKDQRKLGVRVIIPDLNTSRGSNKKAPSPDEVSVEADSGWVALKGSVRVSNEALSKGPVQLVLYPDRGKSAAFVTIKDTGEKQFVRRLWIGNSKAPWKLQHKIVNLKSGEKFQLNKKDIQLQLEAKAVDTSSVSFVAELLESKKWWHYPETITSLKKNDPKLFEKERVLIGRSKIPQLAGGCLDAYVFRRNEGRTSGYDYALLLHLTCLSFGEAIITEKLHLMNKYMEGLDSGQGDSERAIQVLLELRGHKEAREFIHPLLNHRLPRIRLAAAGTLGQQGDKSGLTVATDLLNAPDPDVRADAGWAIGKIQDVDWMIKALPVMVELLNSCDACYAKGQAMHAIANFTIPESIPVVRNWVNHGDRSSKTHAVMSLSRLIGMGHDDLVKEYIKIMNDESVKIRRLAVIQARMIRGHENKAVERGLKKRALYDPNIPVRVAAVHELAARRSAALLEEGKALYQADNEELSAELNNYFLLFGKDGMQIDNKIGIMN